MSHNPVAVLEGLGIPTHSYIAAAQAAGDYRDRASLSSYNKMIKQIMGPVQSNLISHFPIAQLTFGYLIQETVRASVQGNPLDLANLFTTSHEKAIAFFRKEPWHWAEEAGQKAEQKVPTKDRVLDIVTKLASKDRSFVLDALVDELDITETTAMTYMRAALKELDIDAPVKEQPKKVNKKEMALQYMSQNPGVSKAEAISALTTMLDTTPAGAQTYYYGAIKALDITAPKATKRTGGVRPLLKQMLVDNPSMSKIEFLEAAEVEHGVQINTAQTYYYSIVAEMKSSVG